jgi:hypothetical protein
VVNDETKHSNKTPNLLELPQGFFDDEKMESKVTRIGFICFLNLLIIGERNDSKAKTNVIRIG